MDGCDDLRWDVRAYGFRRGGCAAGSVARRRRHGGHHSQSARIPGRAWLRPAKRKHSRPVDGAMPRARFWRDADRDRLLRPDRRSALRHAADPQSRNGCAARQRLRCRDPHAFRAGYDGAVGAGHPDKRRGSGCGRRPSSRRLPTWSMRRPENSVRPRSAWPIRPRRRTFPRTSASPGSWIQSLPSSRCGAAATGRRLPRW